MRILPENTFAIFIDFQERLAPAMYDTEKLIPKTVTLAKGLQELEIPFVVSQQYTKGLGETVSEIKDAIENFSYIDKATFSCCDNEELSKWISDQNKKTVIVCGIEAHICVLQTVIDLLEKDYNVIVVADCVSSRTEYDKKIGLERVRDEGAFVTTTESILFELTRGAKSPHFKVISNLIK